MAAAPVLTGTPGDRKAILSWTNEGPATYKVQRLAGGSWSTIASQTGVNFTQTGLTNGTAYRYRVRCVFEHGPERITNEVSVTPYVNIAPMVAPVLTGTASNGQVSLDWNNLAGVARYNLRRAVGATLNLDYLASSDVSAFTDTGLANGTLYTYSVRGEAADGTLGPQSNQVALTPVAPALPALEAPVISGTAGNASNTLGWNNVTGEDFYRLRRAEAGGAFMVISELTGTSYSDTGLTNDTEYLYTVRALRNNGDQSPISNEIALTPVTPLPDTIPPVLTGTAGNGSISLSWDHPNAVVDYKLQQGPAWATIATLPSTVTSYSITGLINDTSYTYRLRTSYTYGADRFSNEVSAMPKAPPIQIPSSPILAGTAGDGSNSLSWNQVTSATGYRLRRYVGGNTSILYDGANRAYTDSAVSNGTSYDYRAAAYNSSGESPLSGIISLLPTSSQSILGYGSSTTGGAGGQVFNVSTWAELKAAMESTVSPRIVNVIGNGLLDGVGQQITVKTGNMTVNGIGHTRSIKRTAIVVRASNVIFRNLRIRPGDHANLPDAAAGISFNPPTGNTISRIVVQHCHLAWAEDVCLNIFNKTTDVTFQDNMIGPALYESPYKLPGTNGYGLSMHGDADRHARVSVIRNFMVHNPRRNLRAYAVNGAEYVNNVVYNWDDKLSNANPILANFVGNMAKKGPGTQASNEFFSSELFGVDNSYFANSIYWSDNLMWSKTNGVLTPVNDFASGVERGTPYEGGLHNVTATAASLTLMNQVVANAGTPNPDSLEQEYKDDYTNGTWPGDWYRTVQGSPVVPVWP